MEERGGVETEGKVRGRAETKGVVKKKETGAIECEGRCVKEKREFRLEGNIRKKQTGCT